jgi:hypothetical protein
MIRYEEAAASRSCGMLDRMVMDSSRAGDRLRGIHIG